LLHKERQQIEKKEIPDPNKLLMEYSLAYENGVSKLQPPAKQDLLWFLCKAVPAIQKSFKPLRDEKGQEYYRLVSASDEAFAFVCMKNYQEIPDYAIQKILKNDKIEEPRTNKEIENNDGQKAQGEEKVPEEKKKKLSGKKLQVAVSEYDDWHRKFAEIRKNKRCILSNDIRIHSKQMAEQKKTKKQTSHYYIEDSLDLGMMSLVPEEV